ncbi:hypothetical protein Q9966_014277 [Columba livia]|nr:hypothetical protein Q9966_014277 [Columba livia]
MVAPAVLRLDTEEQVVLEAPGLTVATEATLLVQDFPGKRQVLYQVRVPINPAQGMLATATIKVSAKALPPAQGKRFVSVTARVAQVTLEKVLLVSLQSGHIFVQTDKPIYTPSSTVLCRLFALDHRMEPAPKTVVVEFKTPDNIIVKQVPVSSPMKTGIFSLNHYLPEVVSEDGDTWGHPGPLVGTVGDTSVPVATAGSDMVETQRSGIHIVTSPYTIHFTHTPKYFKPGMPFDLTVYVTNPDGSPAPRVTVKADGFQGIVSTQRDGTAKLVLNMPANKDTVPITVSDNRHWGGQAGDRGNLGIGVAVTMVVVEMFG